MRGRPLRCLEPNAPPASPMNHGLLAPQFGLGRILRADADEPSKPVAQPLREPVSPTASGPTILVKRRRHLAGAEATGDAQDTHPPPEVRGQRVYRLDVPPQAVSSGDPAPSAQVVQAVAAEAAPDVVAQAAARSPSRRPRQVVRKPTLIRHEVFEPSPASHADGEAARRSADRAEIQVAMQRLGATLDMLVRGHDAYDALDRHLIALGVR
jgi:hypothetical protein